MDAIYYLHGPDMPILLIITYHNWVKIRQIYKGFPEQTGEWLKTSGMILSRPVSSRIDFKKKVEQW